MKIQENISLAPLTSFDSGGPAEKLITIERSNEMVEAVEHTTGKQIWSLGYGTNVLISDEGLPGTTLLFRNNIVKKEDNVFIADAGVWWDDLVQQAVSSQLWGIEFMSMIPGSVGAAVFINITAYGQSQSDRLEWVEVFDPKQNEINKFDHKEMTWGYKQSIFQQPQNSHLIIVRAAFRLSSQPTGELAYQSAMDIAKEMAISTDTLESRRAVIIEARKRAGSIYIPNQGYEKSVGSFFRNPFVNQQQAEHVMTFDETGKTKEQIIKMNQAHGGDKLRVSAAHVMLAAGYKRGQTWGKVRLHPKHVLKIENTGGATSQEIYDVAQEIIQTVKDKLDITLEPEAQFLGKF